MQRSLEAPPETPAGSESFADETADAVRARLLKMIVKNEEARKPKAQ